MKTLASLCVCLCGLCVEIQAVAGGVSRTYRVEADRSDCLYECGETATFTVTLQSTNGLANALDLGGVAVRLDNFGPGVITNAVFDLSGTNSFTISGTLPKPGFLRIVLPATKSRGADPSDFSVAFEPEKIRKGSPSPDDFDEFWANAVRQFDESVPVDPRLVPVPELSQGACNYWRVSFAAPHGTRAYGFLSIPKEASAGKKYPVRIQVPAAGHGWWTNHMPASDDAICLMMSVHPFDLPFDQEENIRRQDVVKAGLNERYGTRDYTKAGLDVSREDYYFYRAILGINRAVDWLAARPEVDLSNFTYSGTSQGGGFGFFLLGLNRHFTKGALFVPAITDTMGYLAGRQSGWPRPVDGGPEEGREARERNAPYFDGANFASRICCPVRVAVGFSDIVCAPCAVYAAFNEIRVEDKSIVNGIGMTHDCFKKIYNELGAWQREPQRTPGDVPKSVVEGEEWVHMEYRRDILPGSALDFSHMGLQDAPAGKYGWLVSRNGHAEFEGRPGIPARFYGVNLCLTANYLAPDQIEQVTDRLVRLGYNAVRIHHHDTLWKESEGNRDRLDRLIAACVRKGLYLTTDLYVSRRIPWRDLGVDRDGDADGVSAKLLMMTTEAGFENWKRFTREFMTHVNPYTGRSLSEEPAMPLVVLINESSPHSSWDKAKALPEIRALWTTWLAEARAAIPNAFPSATPEAFPEKGGWWDPSPENSAKAAFWSWICGRFSRRAAAFLRDELGARAMLATENNGPTLPHILKMRASLGGYTDFHYYYEHANSASKAERDETGLPLTGIFRNHNPLHDRWHTFPGMSMKRVWGRPLVISESQMGGPNFNRAMAGLITGAAAAVQDWTGIWNFALAHQREKLFDGVDAAPGRFDLSLDPLMQATDRLPALLFLRGDQVTPKAAFANSISDAAMLADAKGNSLPARPDWLAHGLEWRARLGVAFDGEDVPDGVVGIDVADADGPPVLGQVPSCGVAVDGEKGEIIVSGPRTAGGFVLDDMAFDAGSISAKVHGHSALVAATALDGVSFADASRILVWHLTDLHGEGFSWGGKIVKSQFYPHVGILDWGTSRLLAHTGEAEVELDLDSGNNGIHPAEWRVWALGTDGRRECEIPFAIDPSTGHLRFTASTRQPFGACMYYEIVRR